MATTIATSTFAHPIVRAGGRAIIKLGNGNLLAVYHDGAVGFKSREASSEANLASATAVAIAASTDTNDPNSYCLWPDGIFLSIIASTSGASSYQTYSAGAWTAHTAPGTFGNFTEISGFKSGTSFYFVSGGNFGTEFDNHYATSFGGAFTSLGQNNFANSSGVDGFGLVTLPWNSKSLVIGLDSGKNLQWLAKDTLAGVSGGNFAAATSIETLGATPPYKNNLAGVTDSNGNAWMAYNDGTGIVLRMITAAGAAWTAKTSVTAQSTDAYPALFQDTAGNVWVFWVDGAAGNAIKGQKATVSAGAISLSGTVQTISSGNATRTYLSCIESDASNAYLCWVEGTASPYNIIVHAYSIGGGTPTTITLTESGTGTDTISVTGTIPLPTDAANGSESVLFTIPISDSGTGSEAVAFGTISVALSDTGLGAETPTALVSAPLTDTATGSESITQVTVAMPLPDSASGLDAIAVQVSSVPLADTAQGTENIATAITLTLSDPSTGSELASILATITLPTDTATGTDSVTVNTGAGAITLTDTATGAEIIAFGPIATTATDSSGAGVDTLQLTIPLSLAENGTAADVQTTQVTAALADTGIGSDGVSVSASVPLAESGAGSDNIVLGTLSIPLSELGAASEALTVVVGPQQTDTAHANDAITLATIGVTVLDSASGAEMFETAVVFSLPLEAASATDTISVANVNVNVVTVSESGAGAESVRYTPVEFGHATILALDGLGRLYTINAKATLYLLADANGTIVTGTN